MTVNCPYCGNALQIGKPTGPPQKVDHAEVRALRKFGATYTEIGQMFGISRQLAWQICNPKNP